MKQFFAALDHALREGRSFVLVSIVSCTGSAPRGNGAKMAVFENGKTVGTIGGGAVEYVSIQAAMDGFIKKSSWSRVFSLTDADKASLGMVCGGEVEVCFQYIDAHSGRYRELFSRIAAYYKENADVWLLTQRIRGHVTDMGLYEPKAGFEFLENVKDLPKDYEKTFFAGHALKVGDKVSWFIEPLMRSGYTYIFGGGHVAQALVPVIAALEFKPVIYEDREEFCQKSLFPGAFRTICGPFTDIRSRLTLMPEDYVVIMTRGHQCDYEVLTQVLPYPRTYIGVIGSRNKIARTKERLLADGFLEEDFAPVHWPIGLPIQARTPQEIAVSIAAEMILCRAQSERL